MTEPPTPLLGPAMGSVQRAGDATTGTDVDGAQKVLAPAAANAPALSAALAEDGLRRWATASYTGRSGAVPLAAAQFRDATGAYAAWTLLLPPGARLTHPVEGGQTVFATAGGRTVVLAQTVVLVADAHADDAMLRGISAALPKVTGSASLPPLLPTYLPAKGLDASSVRYAIGPAGWTAASMQAGAAGAIERPASTLGWEKSAEAVQAHYTLGGDAESLTMLLYPTPQLAGEHLRALGAAAGTSATRREGELVLIAAGNLPMAAATKLIGSIHLRQIATFDKPMPPSFNGEIRKTASLLTQIVVFTCVLAVAAVLMALFLGGGRALIRVLRGKNAATEAEFLSLHLQPQNPKVKRGDELPTGGGPGSSA